VLPTLWPTAADFVRSAWDAASAAVAVVLVAAAVVLVEFADGTNVAVAVVSQHRLSPANKRLDLIERDTEW